MPSVTTGLSNNTPFTIASMLLSPGIYIVSYQLFINATDAQYSLLNLYVNNNATLVTPPANDPAITVSNYQQIYYFISSATGQIGPINSFILTVTTTTTYYLNYYGKFGGNSQMPFSNSLFRATRIG